MKASLANVEKVLLAVCAGLLTLTAQAAPSDVAVAVAYPPANFQTRNLHDLRQYADDVAVAAGGAETGEVIMSSLAKENPLFRIDSK